MKELCVEWRLALERYRLKYEFNRPTTTMTTTTTTSTDYGHPINRSYPDDVGEDKIG